MILDENQLKEVSHAINLNIGEQIIAIVEYDQTSNKNKIKASYISEAASFRNHNKVINADGLDVEQLNETVKLFYPELTNSSLIFSYTLDPFHNNIYLIVCFDNLKQSINETNQDLVKENIKLKIDNYFLNQQLAIQELKYLSYLKEVKTIKEKLLPAKDHTIEGLDYAVYYKPSIGGGGDYFDIMDLRDARRRAGYEDSPLVWGVGLMDVSGHGPGAAVEVAMVDAILRTYQGQKGAGPADVISYINKYFFTRQFRGGFGTCLLSNYDTSTQIYSYSSAGHLPILVKHQEGSVSVIESKTGIPIGVEKEHEWVTETIQLEPGDSVILFTDGITEAESIKGEQFGFDNLVACFEKSNAKNVEKLMADFELAFNQHTKGVDKNDDETLIIINITCCHIDK